MKILYEKFNDTRKVCKTCLHYPNCQASLYAFEFGVDCCKNYKYEVPYEIYETRNREFIDKVIKLIEEYKDVE